MATPKTFSLLEKKGSFNKYSTCGYQKFFKCVVLLHFSRYNNLNVDQILSSERLVTNYVECLLSRKPCPPEGKDLKRK